MEIGLVEKVDIDSEMQQAYLDYAMSVIVSRALPDARDGLKPVHRRILYAMYDMGLRPDTPYKKSARIVGEVLGKYHPHGDMAVYEAMARMAQDFSMRYLLVDGQGNFGSVDGDSPAAMRYTEARLAAPSQNLLADIQKNTVNFSPNFDGSLSEPDVLPAALPNLLINGATGIAVGMSTSIPPHNLGEVVDALKYMLENWTKLDDLTIEDLMRFIQGPDFPTGGVILQETGEDDLQSAYGSGRGRVIVQAHARLEEMERGRSRIIVTELPYMTNKASLIERIAELVRDERLEGIADLRDESDRHGMRIVIELTRTADPEAVLRDLYKHTPMQGTFSIIMLALVEGEPRMLSLKQALRVYLEHRLEIVKRRSQYDLEKARQRAHILEGLRIALKNLDEVIDLIRKAPDAETARERLMKRFKLTEIQAQAILDLQLRRLASLERKKIEQEYKEVEALIKELEGLLRSPARMRGVIAEELQAVKEAYGDRRRTQIVRMKAGESRRTLLSATDLVQSQAVWVSVTPEGLISRSLDDHMPRLSGNGAPERLVRTNSRDTLYLVSDQGEAAAISVHSLPQNENQAGGVPFWKVSALNEGDRLAGLFTLPPKSERIEGWYVLAATRQGMIKKTDLAELPGPSASGFTLVKVNESDRLLSLRLTNGAAEIVLATAQGMAIRFSEEEVRPMGLVAAGVMGIKLGQGDEVAGMDVLPQPGDVFMISSEGNAKRVPAKDFPKQGRHGQGVVAWKLPGSARLVGLAVGKGTIKAILHLEKLAPKSIRLDAAPLGSRTTRGSLLPDVKGSQVNMLTIPWNPPRPVAGVSGLVGVDGDEPGDDDKGHRGGAGGQGSRGSRGSGGSQGGPVAMEQNGRPKGPSARTKGAAAASAKAVGSSKPSVDGKTARSKTAPAKDAKPKLAKTTHASSKTAPQHGETVKEKTTGKTRQAKTASSADPGSGPKKTVRLAKPASASTGSAGGRTATKAATDKLAPAAKPPAMSKKRGGAASKPAAAAGATTKAKKETTRSAPAQAAPSAKPAGKISSSNTATAAKPTVKSTQAKAAASAKPAGKTRSAKASPVAKTASRKTAPPKASTATKPIGKASSPKTNAAAKPPAGKSNPPKATTSKAATAQKPAGKASQTKPAPAAPGTRGKKKKLPPVDDASQLSLLDLAPVVQKTNPKAAPRKKAS